MLTLLVPKNYKVKNMDVYLEPLIEELQTLWRGIQVHDLLCPLSQCNIEVRCGQCMTFWDTISAPVCSSS